jgi:hypothetical protein
VHYTDHEQRQMDIKSGEALDRITAAYEKASFDAVNAAKQMVIVERQAILALLDDRILAAELNVRDHKNDKDEASQHYLAGYLCGLRDAAFAITDRIKP